MSGDESYVLKEHIPNSTQSFLGFHLSKPCLTPAQIPNAVRCFDVHAKHNKRKALHPLSLESLGEALHVVLERTVVGQELNVSTIDLDATSSLLLQVLLATERGEAPVLGDDDLLATGELVLGAAESLESSGLVCFDLSAHHGSVCKCCVDAGSRLDVLESRVRRLMMIWPMLTRATVPLGLPQAPRIPVCSLSAPAQDNILLIRTTWKG